MHELIEKFREQCGFLGFNWIQNMNLVSDNPKLLFNISGGVIFERIIASGIMPEIPRIASLQSCLRTDNWHKVGISGRHHFVFDMLGHFSLYELNEKEAKKLMIQTAWNYLVNCVGLSPHRLAITIHPRDQISSTVWQECEVANIFYDEGNVNVNPDRTKSGLRTEILWQQKENDNAKNRASYIELWNLVFTQFNGSELFNQPMKLIAVDSGISIDRLITASEDLLSDYNNSRWIKPVALISNQTKSEDEKIIYRLTDMVKYIVLLTTQNLLPGNKAAPYVLRKIIRESYLLSLQIGVSLVDICQQSSNFWTESDSTSKLITKIVEQEINRFQHCLQRGQQVCQKLLRKNKGQINEDDFLYLLNTHGLPRELILSEQKIWEVKQ